MAVSVIFLPRMLVVTFETVYLLLIWLLFASELVITEISHSLTLRLSMGHSLVLGLLGAGFFWVKNNTKVCML